MPNVTFDEAGGIITTFTPEERALGITKARLYDSTTRVKAGGQPYLDDAAYIAEVTQAAGLDSFPDYAAESYYMQYEAKSVTDLEKDLAAAIIQVQDRPDAPTLPTPVVDGVPVRVPRRQAKAILELTEHPVHGDLWKAALAAAASIPDRYTRIVATNYLTEALYFDREKVQEMRGLLGMSAEQADALLIAASNIHLFGT